MTERIPLSTVSICFFSITLFITFSISIRLLGLVIKNSIPALYASEIIFLSTTCETIMKLISGFTSRTSFTTVIPSFTGIRRSTSTISGFLASISATPFSELVFVPIISPRLLLSIMFDITFTELIRSSRI